MVRPFAVKGRKRKHREKYDAESGEDGRQRNQKELKLDEEEEGRDGIWENQSRQEDETKGGESLEGIPILASQNGVEKQTGVTFVVERASLEVTKVVKDDHANFLKKNGWNPADYKPDIVHQALLAILDAHLTRLEKCEPLQLLQKLSITASGKRQKLLQVIKNPVTQYFPVNARRIGFSQSSKKLVEVQDYVASVSDETPLVFVVGALAHGKIEAEYTDDFIAISTYPLSNMICDVAYTDIGNSFDSFSATSRTSLIRINQSVADPRPTRYYRSLLHNWKQGRLQKGSFDPNS